MKPGLHPPEVRERLWKIAAAYEDALDRLRNAADAEHRKLINESIDLHWLRLYHSAGSGWLQYVVEERRRRALC